LNEINFMGNRESPSLLQRARNGGPADQPPAPLFMSAGSSGASPD